MTKAELQQELETMKALLAKQETKVKPAKKFNHVGEYVFENGSFAKVAVSKFNSEELTVAYYFNEYTRKPIYFTADKVNTLAEAWDELVELIDKIAD